MEPESVVFKEINPLVIPKVLQKVLTFLTTFQLKNCRLVNTQFNSEACILLRKHERILFSSAEDLTIFTKVYSSTTNFPYESFIFSSDLLDTLIDANRNNCNISNDKIIFDDFCTQLGCYVFTAHFNFNFTDTKNGFIKLIKTVFQRFSNLKYLSLLMNFKAGIYPKVFHFNDKTMPRLKKLCINFSGFDENKSETTLESFITSILTNCPNLERISSKLPSTNNDNNDNEQISVLQPSEKLGKALLRSILALSESQKNLKHLSEIEILLKTNEDDLNSLTNRNFKLRKCYLELANSNKDLEMLSRFICKYKYNLEFLYLELPYGKIALQDINLHFNAIPCLKTIHLVNYTGSLTFLKKCPSIEKVHLKNLESKLLKSRDYLPISTSLRELKIIFRKLSRSHLPKEIAIWFPNLDSLFLENVDNEIIQCVFENLKSLRDLTLIGNSITDGGICGESDKILKLLIESMALDAKSKASLDSWNYQPRFPSICNLKHLQYCKIEANLISDASIVFGLALCKRLQKLHVFSGLELITNFGVMLLLELEDLREINVFIRNFGWADLNELRILASQ